MTVYKVEGPNKTNVIEPIVYQNLSDYLRFNSHGLQEVNIDLDKIKVLTTADLLAEVIHRVQNFESIS